jgi:hypothetical protein
MSVLFNFNKTKDFIMLQKIPSKGPIGNIYIWQEPGECMFNRTSHDVELVAGDYTPITIHDRPVSSMNEFGSIIYGTETFYRGHDTVTYLSPAKREQVLEEFFEDDIPF